MTTVAGEEGSLNAQLGALSIADAPAPGAGLTSSSSAEVLGEAHGGGHSGVAAATTAAACLPRKAWKSPPRIPQPDLLVMEEPSSSWPVLSRDGSSSRNKHRNSESLPREAVSSSEVDTGSVENTAHADRQEEENGEALALREGAQTVDSVAVEANHRDPRPSRPPFRPFTRQQQARPPVLNGHRGRNRQFFPHHHRHGGRQPQQRPRHQRNVTVNVFPHQQHTQVFNGQGFHPMRMGYPVPSPEWWFNPAQNLQWGPNTFMNPTHMNTFAPPNDVSPRGYFNNEPYFAGEIGTLNQQPPLGFVSGVSDVPRGYFNNEPYFTGGLPYPAPPIPPILPPPLGQNPAWFVDPPPASPAEAAFQSRVMNQPLPRGGQPQPPPRATQEGDENVHARLRTQIEYYFSDQNLVTDWYLKTCMDEEGWVSVHVIASFPRVQRLTRNTSVILEALQTSPVLDICMEKIRRKIDWQRWLLQDPSTPDSAQETST